MSFVINARQEPFYLHSEYLNQALNRILDTVVSCFDTGGRRGFFFVAANAQGFPLLAFPVGEIPAEKFFKYAEFALEKARRLGQHSEHMTSWQSRDPDNGQWGGAIRVPGCQVIFSISGLPEDLDAAASLALACLKYSSISYDLMLDINRRNSSQPQLETLMIRMGHQI